MQHKFIEPRRLSVLAFSLLFAYLLSFVFEGQVLYGLTDYFGVSSTRFIFAAIFAHFIGLFCCGFFVKNPEKAKKTMLFGIVVCFAGSLPFFFHVPFLWTVSLMACALFSGFAVAAWGYFLRSCTPKNERIKTCADVLIYSNILMILINLTAVYISPFMGLSFSMLALLLAGYFTTLLPVRGERIVETGSSKISLSLKVPMLFLGLFVVILTINSGLMYQVFNPAFKHMIWLTSWYWAVPYIVALTVMRNLPMKANRSKILYIGMAMIMGAFISFMLLGRNASDYLIVDTLMLGACGIFDLFWWSIIGEMLEYTDNAAQPFGIGLSANVFGVLCGGVLGMAVTSIGLQGAEVAVIALTVVCVTLVMLPPLNRQLVLLLKSHAYLADYDRMSETQQNNIIRQTKPIEELTDRENEVLQHILSGKSNREIAATLYISESTVKTHARNIFSKYNVGSRAELISILLKNQSQS